MPLGMRDCSQPYSYPVGVAKWLVFIGVRKKSAVGRSTSITMSVAYLRHICMRGYKIYSLRDKAIRRMI